MLKLYDYDSNANWAGIGVFTNGLPWIRNGLDILNSSGRTMVRVPPTGGIAIGGDGTGDSAAINYGSYTLSLGTFGNKDVNISSGAVGIGMNPSVANGKLSVSGVITSDTDVCIKNATVGTKCLTSSGGSGTGITDVVGGAGISVTKNGAGNVATITNTKTLTVVDSIRNSLISSNGDDVSVSVQCPAGSIVVGGGGACDNGTLGQSEVYNNGWITYCQRFTSIANPADKPVAHVRARCLTYQ
jgi:hypothetical protein